MGFVFTKTSDHGTQNPIVARLSVQSRQLMDPFSLAEEKKNKIWSILHDKIQHQLLTCYDIWHQTASRELEIIRNIEENGIPTQSHGRVASVEQIENLKHLSDSFLYSAKSALRDIKSLVCEFFETDPKKRKKIEDDNFEGLSKWAKGRFGESDDFTKLLFEDYGLWINEVFSKRNAVEHPGGSSGHLEVLNFSAIRIPNTNEWKTTIPQWRRNQDQPSLITNDMQITIENILHFSEDILVHCLLKFGSMVPVVFYEIESEKRDVDCPIRLRVTLDREKLKSQQGSGGNA